MAGLTLTCSLEDFVAVSGLRDLSLEELLAPEPVLTDAERARAAEEARHATVSKSDEQLRLHYAAGQRNGVFSWDKPCVPPFAPSPAPPSRAASLRLVDRTKHDSYYKRRAELHAAAKEREKNQVMMTAASSPTSTLGVRQLVDVRPVRRRRRLGR